MGTIVTIGGGELGGFSTLKIDEYIVKLTKKENPKALFIPTASEDELEYIEEFNKVYNERLGCITNSLCLIRENLSDEEIKDKILSSDLIYVGGGNTKMMVDLWKEKNVDIYLREAYEKGIVLSGLSAGSICWHKNGYGQDRSNLHISDEIKFIRLEGLNYINAIHCPHYNQEERQGFGESILENEVGIGIDDNVAIVYKDDKFKVIKSDKKASAYKLVNINNEVIKTNLDNNEFICVSNLLR